MAAAVGLRDDLTATDLRRLAQSRRDAGQVRRLLTLAVIYDGGSRSEAARTGGVGLQTVRDWVLRFNREGPDGLIDGKAPGGRPRLDANQRAALAAAVESGPIPAAHGVVRWRLVDLVQWIRDEFAVSISTQTLSRELRAMGYRKLSARPRHHAQDADAIPTFKKTSPPRWRRSGRRSPAAPLELWWQDEARVGQKNGITRRWAKRGTRPSAPKDQRTTSAYIYGAICPAEGKGAALVLPRCNTEGMTLHLAEISAAVAPGAHAVLILDQAGWHLSAGLIIPANITLLPLPAKCPELNPVENVWQFMRDNWLSNRIFKSYDDILDHCCFAWSRLMDQPWRIMSIGLRQWAHG
ncbi:IS630 family transposase [Aurantimonas aggregata]|uniref:IS630 family transposase n=1 Tax=Aurantimonas aggregata TaxID=2047720 RepID=A0A6L9MI77_9HYPH|nr:IS630 family transposase [Aurantimonas aggregata]